MGGGRRMTIGPCRHVWVGCSVVRRSNLILMLFVRVGREPRSTATLQPPRNSGRRRKGQRAPGADMTTGSMLLWCWRLRMKGMMNLKIILASVTPHTHPPPPFPPFQCSDSPPARRGGRRQPDPVSYDDSSGDDSGSSQTSSSGDGSGAADARDSGEVSDDDRPRSGHRQAAAPMIDTAQAGANASDSATPVGTDGSTDTGGTPHPRGLPLPVADLSAIARRASSRTFREQIQVPPL